MSSTRSHELVGDTQQRGFAGNIGVKAIAKHDLLAGSVVFTETGPITNTRSAHSIQINAASHCEILGEGRFCAHSTEPTCFVRILENNALQIVTRVDVSTAKDLSLDYNATEWEVAHPFIDHQSGTLCRGFKHLAEDQKVRLLNRAILPRHIIAMWRAETDRML